MTKIENKTCATCEEFWHKTETCNCPLNAYPSMFSEFSTYAYAKTTAETNACSFYREIPVKLCK